VFADRGVRYWGVDLSAAMLGRAPRDHRLRLIQGDARSLEIPDALPDGFDLVWCPINSIRHLTLEADILAHLGRVRELLGRSSEPGWYVMETDLCAARQREAGTEGAPTPGGVWSVERPDGSVIHARWERLGVDLDQRLCEERATLQLELDGRILRELSHVYTMRVWTFDDLMSFMSRAGLRVERAHQNVRGRPEALLSSELEGDGRNYLFFMRAARLS
jgi:hypothetical protein